MQTQISELPLPAAAKMPHGVGNAYLFQVFHTMSYAVVLGAPMLLYFKSLQASATVLGIVAALPALMNILQIPAARFVEQVGYRAFVLRGWSVRCLFALAIALVPMLPARIDAATRMALMLFALFAYNTARGISVCGFLPWITQWIPENVRGRYISGDQMCSSIASVIALLAAAMYLRHETSRIAFGVVFAASFVAAVASLSFLRRIPDVPPPRGAANSSRVPWKDMALFPPFFRLLLYNFVICIALGGSSVFWVPCLRDQFGLTDMQILVFGASTPVVMAACLHFWISRVLDRVGSKPVLALANLTLAIHLLSWAALAGRLIPLRLWSIALIQGTAGLGLAALAPANQRLAMSIVPAMGRSHFLALFSVVGGLTLGIFPVLWGIALDSLAGWHAGGKWWEWNQFSALYIALAAVALAAQMYAARLTEPRAITTEEFFRELFVETPARAITRLIARRPFS